jgi:hypothetical protein
MLGVQRMMRALRKHAERDDRAPCRAISALGTKGRVIGKPAGLMHEVLMHEV